MMRVFHFFHKKSDVKNKEIEKPSVLENKNAKRNDKTSPQSYKNESNVEAESDYFEYLATNADDLGSILRSHPEIIKKQDENGMTILHHAAIKYRFNHSNEAKRILNLLLNSPDIDFTITDSDGNTPVHTAAFNCENEIVCLYIFPEYVKRAAELGFDFSMLGEQGQTVLHIAARYSYHHPIFGRTNNINNVLKNAPNIDLDVLSSSGSTAYFYAINNLYLKEAQSLLDAGADPLLFGKPDRNPLVMIEGLVKNCASTLAEEKDGWRAKKLNKMLEALNNLRQRMVAIDLENKQQKADKFLFWTKTKEVQKWNKIDIHSDGEYDRPLPGCGF